MRQHAVGPRIDPRASLKPGMRIEVTPAAGQTAQHEAAQAVNALLVDFLR